MSRNSILILASLVMFILGIIILTIGVTAGPKVLIPPVITGIGFFVIAGVFMILRQK